MGAASSPWALPEESAKVEELLTRYERLRQQWNALDIDPEKTPFSALSESAQQQARESVIGMEQLFRDIEAAGLAEYINWHNRRLTLIARDYIEGRPI